MFIKPEIQLVEFIRCFKVIPDFRQFSMLKYRNQAAYIFESRTLDDMRDYIKTVSSCYRQISQDNLRDLFDSKSFNSQENDYDLSNMDDFSEYSSNKASHLSLKHMQTLEVSQRLNNKEKKLSKKLNEKDLMQTLFCENSLKQPIASKSMHNDTLGASTLFRLRMQPTSTHNQIRKQNVSQQQSIQASISRHGGRRAIHSISKDRRFRFDLMLK